MEAVVASSPVDAGIGCWDLRSGAERLRYRSCASSPHGLLSVAGRFLASSQLRETSSSSGSILYWSWDKPHVEVKSFPAEPIFPLVSNCDGSYLLGGGSTGNIYLWEIASGKLLKKWQAHYRAVSCLVFSDDESFLISGSDDGCVRVWSLLRIFDERENSVVKHPYQYSFQEHTLRVTDVVSGYGLCNSIAISSSEDHTCKVWSLSRGKLLRSITFPCIVNAVALDPGEHVFYAGGRDGKIYVAALSADCTSSSIYGTYIIGCLSDHSKAVTCLTFSTDGVTLVSGSEDGTVRVWDTKSQQVIRILKHAKGPVNNVLIVRQPMNECQTLADDEMSSRKCIRLSIPPPLDKYVDSTEGGPDTKPVSTLLTYFDEPLESTYRTSHVMMEQIRELQQQSSSAAAEMELERLREERKVSLQLLQQRKKVFEDLWKVHVNELLDGS